MKNIIKLHWLYKYIDQAALWHSQLKDFEKKIQKKTTTSLYWKKWTYSTQIVPVAYNMH